MIVSTKSGIIGQKIDTHMYREYFGFSQQPFSIVPDPRYFYTSQVHREALAHLLYGIQSDGGFVLLTGDVGTGKTTVCRRLLELMPQEMEVAFILNPKMTAEELLASVCDEFRISYPPGTTSVKVFVSLINDFLLDVHGKGRKAVLIIEEAQNLKPDVLEQVRLLTNLETKEHKLLQIILLGQPELRDLLNRPELLQLSQRITARYHLGPLSQEDVQSYVNHRLSIAGHSRGHIFPPSTMKKLFRLSKGVPRLINVICDRALLGAYVEGKDQVDLRTLAKAAREVTGKTRFQGREKVIYQAAAGALLLLVVVVFASIYYAQRDPGLQAAGVRTAPHESADKTVRAAVKEAALDRPAEQSDDSMRKMAYTALFREWHVEYRGDDSRDVCSQAAAQGLRCLKGKGSVSHLKQMNRPAVLRVVDGKNREYPATLISLKGDAAKVVVGNETKSVDLKEITEWWSGDYLLLWKAPPEYREELRPGGRGPIVAWVDKQLSLSLVKQVKRLQLSSGLIPDGVIGPRTIMSLNAAARAKEPLLLDGKTGSGG